MRAFLYRESIVGQGVWRQRLIHYSLIRRLSTVWRHIGSTSLFRGHLLRLHQPLLRSTFRSLVDHQRMGQRQHRYPCPVTLLQSLLQMATATLEVARTSLVDGTGPLQRPREKTLTCISLLPLHRHRLRHKEREGGGLGCQILRQHLCLHQARHLHPLRRVLPPCRYRSPHQLSSLRRVVPLLLHHYHPSQTIPHVPIPPHRHQLPHPVRLRWFRHRWIRTLSRRMECMDLQRGGMIEMRMGIG